MEHQNMYATLYTNPAGRQPGDWNARSPYTVGTARERLGVTDPRFNLKHFRVGGVLWPVRRQGGVAAM